MTKTNFTLLLIAITFKIVLSPLDLGHSGLSICLFLLSAAITPFQNTKTDLPGSVSLLAPRHPSDQLKVASQCSPAYPVVAHRAS